MDKDKAIKYGKIIGICLVLGLIIWFLIISPLFTFKSNENKMLKAGKRYFEVNSSELPTGSRVKTVLLKDLYSKGFLEDDLYVPLSSKACSVTNSFVKVKRVDGEYKYYTYLECGVLKSMTDNKGPEIVLNGDSEITINKGDKYKELGVKSVKDNTDGTIDKSSVEVDSKSVDTSKVGTYEVTYTAFDSLSNKTVATRKVKVVARLKNTVNEVTNNLGYYTGINPNNYIYFSGMLFRIIGVNGDNVKIIAESDISNVNYDGIDEWFDYYYDHLTSKAKKMIVKDKYCNMNVSDDSINTVECSSYSKSKNIGLISIDELNRSLVDGSSYLKPASISWTANKYDENNAYVTRNIFFGDEYGKSYMKMDTSSNYGVRPVITIKGSSLIKSGNGTIDDPYSLGDFTYGKSDQLINTRYTGEYIKYSGYTWRIIDVDDDGTTKVICDDNLKDDGVSVTTYYDTDSKSKIYNVKEKGNIGYFIDNKASSYISEKYFVEKNIEVPIYKDKINYKKEVSTKKYKTKLSAPNMYEMFSAFNYIDNSMQSYWLINSSKNSKVFAVVSDIGVVLDEGVDEFDDFGIRPVGYLNKNVKIVNGKGLESNPYVIAK